MMCVLFFFLVLQLGLHLGIIRFDRITRLQSGTFHIISLNAEVRTRKDVVFICF